MTKQSKVGVGVAPQTKSKNKNRKSASRPAKRPSGCRKYPSSFISGRCSRAHPSRPVARRTSPIPAIPQARRNGFNWCCRGPLFLLVEIGPFVKKTQAERIGNGFPFALPFITKMACADGLLDWCWRSAFARHDVLHQAATADPKHIDNTHSS